ncbi:universal stress protein [Kitasatospora sp. RG8]|uniref:universal stress protein n=1 Tax=Kitasatospora sp. RG8 TaxID=2820815 RepID=UPI001AE03B3C|nr:universal stress protein [Kitasatospora sp. RG8]MBP0449027.1 universal stress protein [Kitasatospora sp. RG8]
MTAASSDGRGRPVVLGVDAAAPGPMATAWAADEAARRGLPLLLVHAVPPQDFHALDEERRRARRREQAYETLDRAAAAARERHPDLDVSTVVAEEVPALALCRESARAGLVVLGTRRLSRMEEVLSTFSVTVPVSAQAHCPVVVVREPEHVTQESPYVVVGVDGSASSAAAVDVAIGLAAERHADLRAVQVWHRPAIGRVDPQSTEQELRRLLVEATAGPRGLHPEVHVAHEVVHGHPVEELAKASEHALAVVVGRRGDGGFTGMRLGSVPHGLLHRAHCPVVTVPTPPDDGK